MTEPKSTLALSADTLADILDGKLKASVEPPPAPVTASLPLSVQDAPESPPASGAGSTPTPSPSGQPKLPADVQRAIAESAAATGTAPPLRAFGSGPPATSTEAILGRRVEARAIEQPSGPLVDVPSSGRPLTGSSPKLTSDPLGDDRAAAERDMKRTRGRAVAEAALRDLCKEYPSTKLINIRVHWRDPNTGEFHYKGRRKNVSMNELRDPTDIIGNRGENWMFSFQAADQGLAWDDPKTWRSFEFDRDGPQPPREWTLETPEEDNLVVEVEGMGTIPVKELRELFESWNKPAQQQQQPVAVAAPPGQVPPYLMPPRDHRAEERENELRKMVEETRRQNELLLQRMSEKDREAEQARHRAEIETQKAGFMAILESMKSKMDSMEFKLNQPPPPPPPPPQVQHTDFATALLTVAPHIKDIFTANKQSETEQYRLKELELQKERDRMERESRERHDLFQRELERQREETKHTMEMYRLMGEQSKESSRAIAEFVGKQNDPTGTMSVLKMATDQSVQQMQLFATLAKAGLMGGGGGQAQGVDWGDLVGRGFEMLGNIGAAFAESSAAKAKAAAQIAASQSAQLPAQTPSPSFAGQPQQAQPQAPVRIPRAAAPARPVPEPVEHDAAQDEAPPSADPLKPFIADVNHSIQAREDPEKVANKIATVVRMAINFGDGKKNLSGPLRLLMEKPKDFLLQAYTTKEYEGTPPEYLIKIADVLLETFGPEDEDDDEKPDEAEDVEAGTETETEDTEAETPSEQPVQVAPAAPPSATPPPEPTNGGSAKPRRGRRPRVVQEALPNVPIEPVTATSIPVSSVPSTTPSPENGESAPPNTEPS